jgi:hypothetical protein
MNKIMIAFALLVFPFLALADDYKETVCDPVAVGITLNGGALVQCKDAVDVGGNKIKFFAVNFRAVPRPDDIPPYGELRKEMTQTMRTAISSNHKLWIRYFTSFVGSAAFDCQFLNCREIQSIYIVK